VGVTSNTGRRQWLAAMTGTAGGLLAAGWSVGSVAAEPSARPVAADVPPGLAGDGVADDAPAIQTALDAAAARGGLVALPRGRYRLASPLRPRRGVMLVGAGSATVLLPEGRAPAIGGEFSSASPLTGFHCRDLAIDGINQSGPYTSFAKGIYVTHLSGCSFVNLLVVATAATGIGIDYLYDGTTVRDCRVVACGRLNGGGQPGGAGIGIGTGSRPLESFVITGNHCAGNARFGIFVEAQTSLASTGGRIIANACEQNRHGIGDAGMAGLVVAGNICVGNTGSGIVVDSGTLSPIVGREGHVVDNVSSRNGEFGIHVDTTVGPGGRGYTFRGNRCERNGKAGVKLSSNATRAIVGIVVADNDIHENGSVGIHVTSTGAVARDLSIAGNRLAGNGQTNTAGFTQAVRLDTTTERFGIVDNTCWDAGSPKRQTVGIQLTAGATFTDGCIAGNHVTGNAAAGLDLAGRLVGCRVADNLGDVVAPPRVVAVGPSPWTYTAGASAEVLYISGGSGTAVAKAGVVLAAPTVHLQPNQQITLTYAAAPRVVVERR
jgi:hypothetical protein